MNPTKDLAVWVVGLLPDAAPLWLEGAMVMFAIFAALFAITAPLCGFAHWVSTRQERKEK